MRGRDHVGAREHDGRLRVGGRRVVARIRRRAPCGHRLGIRGGARRGERQRRRPPDAERLRQGGRRQSRAGVDAVGGARGDPCRVAPPSAARHGRDAGRARRSRARVRRRSRRRAHRDRRGASRRGRPSTTREPAPEPAADEPTSTTTPTTTAAPVTTTTRPRGVPADWPPDKPIPPMPPNCQQPQLEDNGVWNCQDD